MAVEIEPIPGVTDDAVPQFILTGRARSLDEAEELFLDEFLPAIMDLVMGGHAARFYGLQQHPVFQSPPVLRRMKKSDVLLQSDTCRGGATVSEPITLLAPVINLTTPPCTKWEREYRAFRQLLPQLLATYKDRYVAIHEGQVVDSSDDKLALALRVLAKVGNVAIHVGLVTEEPEPVFRRPLSKTTEGYL